MPTIIGTLPVTLQNGTTADASQVMSDFNFIVNQVNANALPTGSISAGALVNIQIFTANGTYTPSANATKAIVEGVGGGAAGGGTQATSSSQTAVGAPGGSPAYAKAWWLGPLSSQTVTIGAGGVGSAGANGANGGTTSLGTLISIPGANGGAASGATAVFPAVMGVGPASTVAPTLSGVTTIISRGGSGASSSYAVANNAAVPGVAGSSPFGQGGVGTVSSVTDFSRGNPLGFGASGAGFTSSNNGAQQSGYSGSAGLLIIYEYA